MTPCSLVAENQRNQLSTILDKATNHRRETVGRILKVSKRLGLKANKCE